MDDGESERGAGESAVPTIRRRDYLGAIGSVGAASVLGATADGLVPGAARERAVVGVGPDGAGSAAASVTTATPDQALVGRYECETIGTTARWPANWATVTTTDVERREVRVRGGLASGGTCGRATVHEIRYDEAADELRIVVDAVPDGSRDCTPAVEELNYEVTATLARTPQSVVVEHRDEDWRRSTHLHASGSDAPLDLSFERPAAVLVDGTTTATVTLNDVPAADASDYEVRVDVADPSVARIAEAESPSIPGAEVAVAEDGASVTVSGTDVTRTAVEREDGALATVTLEGVGRGWTRVTSAVDRSVPTGTDPPVVKAASERDLGVAPYQPVPSEDVGLFAVDRRTDALELGWVRDADEDDTIVVSVDGTERKRLGRSELDDVRDEWVHFAGTTVEGLAPDTDYEFAVEAVAPDGETRWRRTASLSTLPSTGIVDCEFTPTRWDRARVDFWGDVAVSEDRTRVEAVGEFYFGSTPNTVWLRDVAFSDGTLTLSVHAAGRGHDEAIENVGYRCRVDLDRPVERVVLDHAGQGYRRIWDAAAGGGFERFAPRLETDAVAPGERTELSLSLDGVPETETNYGISVFVDDPSVARIAGATVPSWAVDGDDRTVEDDGFSTEVTVSPDEHDPTAPVDLGTLTVEGVAPGTANVGYSVSPEDDGPIETGLGGYFGPALDVTEGGTPDAETRTTTAETDTRTTAPSTPGRVGSNTAFPADPDDDDLYEDVNGNDRRDIADAVDLFRNRESVDAEYFDFNDSGGVSIGDAVSLFRENTS